MTNNASKHRRTVQKKFAQRGLNVRLPESYPLDHTHIYLQPSRHGFSVFPVLLRDAAQMHVLRQLRQFCFHRRLAQVPVESIITAGSATAEYLSSRGLDSVYLIGEPGLAEVRPRPQQ